jgi:septation ring formation regulator EzrA
MTMESLAELLEQELEGAVEVKDKQSLHRYITLLTENLVRQDRNEREHTEFREAILRIDTRMEEGFRRMDERFAAVDKQFESVNKRFEDVNRHFDDVNKRFDDVNKRFDDVNKRFEDVHKKFTMLFSFITLGFVLMATLMSIYQFLG